MSDERTMQGKAQSYSNKIFPPIEESGIHIAEASPFRRVRALRTYDSQIKSADYNFGECQPM